MSRFHEEVSNILNLLCFLKQRRILVQRDRQKSSGKFDRTAFQPVVFLFLLCLLGQKSYAKTVSGEITRIGDATHLEFQGLDQWNYDLKRIDNRTIEMTLPAFDDKTRVNLQTWQGHLVEKTSISEGATSGELKLIIKFTRDDVESFDYLTDDPSRLIVDFYVQAPEPKNETAQDSKESSKAAGDKSAKKAKPRRVKLSQDESAKKGYTKVSKDRKPAGDEFLKVDEDSSGRTRASDEREAVKGGAYDSGDPDFSRFMIRDYEIKEDSIIASRHNIYIRFPMLEMPTSRLTELVENPPEYVIKPKETKENKEARLLLTLYSRGRDSVFLKTFDYFKKTYPESIYDEIVNHLAAELHFKLWRRSGDEYHRSQFESIYRYLLNKYPESPLAERTNLLLGYVNLESNDGMATLQHFQKFLDKYPGSSELDQAYKALAAGYIDLNKYDDALRVYTTLEKSHKEDLSGIEASYRKGDVFVSQRKHQEAINAYSDALKKYPHQEAQFPNAHYNMAESYFWLGQYKKGLEHYIQFLKLFPSHEHGGYAMTRIGEILDIMGADTSRVMGAFLESFFRYRSNPGAAVARIRMLSQQMKGMKQKELSSATEEMEQISQTSKLPNIKEFISLMVADGYQRRRDYEKALAQLIPFYQKNPTSANLDFFQKRIERNITDGLKDRVDRGRFMEALTFYGRYADTWMKNSDRMDVSFLLGRSYELAGAFAEAEKVYRATLERLNKIEGTAEAKERRVNEHLPTPSSVHLRLAATSANQREFGEAHRHLRTIQDASGFTEAEQIEKVEIAAMVSEERGRIDEAKKHLSHLAETWKGNKEKLVPVHLRLAKLHMKTKDHLAAQESADEVLKLAGADEVKPADQAEALELKGESLVEQGKKMAAVEVFTQLLDTFDGKRPLGSVRYQTGQILFDQGDIVGAEKIWKGLDPKNDSIYRELADEKMKHAKWQDEYQRYIERIPAMSKKQ